MVKRLTKWRPIAVRRIGRLRLRWKDDVRVDLGKMKIQNWSKMTMDRETWKRIVQQAKTHRVVVPRGGGGGGKRYHWRNLQKQLILYIPDASTITIHSIFKKFRTNYFNKLQNDMGFELLMAVTMKFTILWDMRCHVAGELQPDYQALHPRN
jgi:hypothetical protein